MTGPAGQDPSPLELPEAEAASSQKSASMVPLLVLYHQAWELAQQEMITFERLEWAAQAVALSKAIAALVEEVGDEAYQVRWSVRVSEAEHWLCVVRDALTSVEEKES